jgi:hypothetical protein
VLISTPARPTRTPRQSDSVCVRTRTRGDGGCSPRRGIVLGLSNRCPHEARDHPNSVQNELLQGLLEVDSRARRVAKLSADPHPPFFRSLLDREFRCACRVVRLGAEGVGCGRQGFHRNTEPIVSLLNLKDSAFEGCLSRREFPRSPTNRPHGILSAECRRLTGQLTRIAFDNADIASADCSASCYGVGATIASSSLPSGQRTT